MQISLVFTKIPYQNLPVPFTAVLISVSYPTVHYPIDSFVLLHSLRAWKISKLLINYKMIQQITSPMRQNKTQNRRRTQKNKDVKCERRRVDIYRKEEERSKDTRDE